MFLRLRSRYIIITRSVGKCNLRMRKYRNRNRSDERMPRSLRRGKVRDARVKCETKRRGFYGEVVSFNVKTKKYLVKFKSGDENPVP